MNKKKYFFTIGIIICTSLMWIMCTPGVEAPYTPSEEFLPAYKALMDAQNEAQYIYEADSSNYVSKTQIKPENGEEYYLVDVSYDTETKASADAVFDDNYVRLIAIEDKLGRLLAVSMYNY